jgi:hypothetical protein
MIYKYIYFEAYQLLNSMSVAFRAGLGFKPGNPAADTAKRRLMVVCSRHETTHSGLSGRFKPPNPVFPSSPIGEFGQIDDFGFRNGSNALFHLRIAS